mgnify:CR=1 FL=1
MFDALLCDALLCDALCLMLFCLMLFCMGVFCMMLFCLMLFCGVTSFIANYLITLPQACKPVFLLFSPQKGGAQIHPLQADKKNSAKCRSCGYKTYKKSHFSWFGLRKHGGNTFKYLQKVAFWVFLVQECTKRGTIVFDRGVTGGAKM